MDINQTLERQQFNNLFDYRRAWGMDHEREHIGILEHLYLSSDGFAIALDVQAPWFVRRTPSAGICFSVGTSRPYMDPAPDSGYLEMKLHLFSSTNIRTVLDYVIHESGLVPRPTALPDERFIARSIWFGDEIADCLYEDEFHTLTISEVLAEQMASHGFSLKEANLVLDKEFDSILALSHQAKNQTELVSRLHSAGFSLVGAHLSDLNANDSYWRDSPYAIDGRGTIDFSDPAALVWFEQELTAFRTQTKIDFYVLSAEGADIESIEQLNDVQMQKYPSLLVPKYLEAAQTLNVSLITEHGFKTQHIPAVVRLTYYRHFNPYDRTLAEFIPNVLSASIAGYSYLMPYSAGGFVCVQPDAELFIRLVQAQALMPVMSFTQVPWYFGADAERIAQKFMKLHAEFAQTFLELGKSRFESGSPIVRPMWYHAPDDPRAYLIGDQYMIGEDLAVAPVMQAGVRRRSVYLPPGIWIDQHGVSFKGPGEITVAVPLEELPYFVRNKQ